LISSFKRNTVASVQSVTVLSIHRSPRDHIPLTTEPNPHIFAALSRLAPTRLLSFRLARAVPSTGSISTVSVASFPRQGGPGPARLGPHSAAIAAESYQTLAAERRVCALSSARCQFDNHPCTAPLINHTVRRPHAADQLRPRSITRVYDKT